MIHILLEDVKNSIKYKGWNLEIKEDEVPQLLIKPAWLDKDEVGEIFVVGVDFGKLYTYKESEGLDSRVFFDNTVAVIETIEAFYNLGE